MITYKRKQKIKAFGVLNKINEVCLLFARLPLRSETNSTDQYLKSNFGCLLSESQSSLPPPKNGTRVPNPLPHKEPKNSDYEFGIGQNAITEYKFEMWRKLKSKALKWFRLAKIQLEWQRQRQRQQSSTAANVLNNNNNRHFRRTPRRSQPLIPGCTRCRPYCGTASGYWLRGYLGSCSFHSPFTELGAQFFRCMQF